MVVLGYFELPDDDQPDEKIWGHAERLEEWFEAIKQRREQGLTSIDDDEVPSDMTSNELTAELIGD